MLYELINVVHSGFLNGRFIEENVKMIYNTFTMQHTEQNQIPALLMLIDFENVFGYYFLEIYLGNIKCVLGL